MKRVQNLSKILGNLKTISTKIIENAVPIMKDLKNEDSDLVADVLDELGNSKEYSKDYILSLLQDETLSLVEDAQAVHREMEYFAESVIQGEDALMESEEDYPYLLQVWCGDVYNGTEGVDALQKLYAELKENLGMVTEEEIVDAVCRRLEE